MMFPTLAIGSSMKPTIGFIGFTMTRRFEKYYPGDIIELLTHDGRIHIHRIVSIDDYFVTTKGDNYKFSMPYEIHVPIKNIRGKIVWSFPRMKK